MGTYFLNQTFINTKIYDIIMGIKKRIVKLNKGLGGTLVRPGNLDFASDKFETEKNIYRKNAHLIRAIVVDHPFDDFNKSTATLITLREFKKEGIKCKEESYLRGIRNIAKNNETNINKIEKKLRKWCQRTSKK